MQRHQSNDGQRGIKTQGISMQTPRFMREITGQFSPHDKERNTQDRLEERMLGSKQNGKLPGQ